MTKPVATLAPGFNKVSLKKGDTFKIVLFEGGIAGTSYAFEVVSGKASFVESSEPSSGGIRSFIFKAEEAGKLEIVAQGKDYGFGGTKTASPISYKLKVQ